MSRIRPASRTHAKPLIGFYSESSGGKTYSALLLARGFAGKTGRICMIETESGRGEAYADPREYPEFAGSDPNSNYDVLSLREDFSPKNYGEAIAEAEEGGYDVLIIDSGSHEWEGAGGVLDMAAQNEAAGKKGVQIWQKPKIDHQRHFMLKFMQTPIPLVIMNMRAKYPMVGQGANMKRSDQLDPKQSEDILYEMTVQGWMEKDTHRFNPAKRMPKSLFSVFVPGEPISLDTGRRLAEWAKGAPPKAGDTVTPETVTKTVDESPEKKMARKILKEINEAPTSQHLWDIVEQEYADDLVKIKAASQNGYDNIMTEYKARREVLRKQEGIE